MITTAGKLHIKRYLSGLFTDIGRSIAFGIGSKAPALTDDALQFEVSRVPVDLLSYDYVNDRLIFKGSIPNDFAGRITEVGIFSREASNAGANGSRMLASFDSTTELWYVGTSPAAFSVESPYIGTDSAIVTAPSGQNFTITMQNVNFNLVDYSAADKLSFAFQAMTGNISSIQFRFATDAANYYTFTVAANEITTGLNIIQKSKISAVPTGTPDWAAVNSISVITTSTSGGASTVKFEGIRIEDTDTIDEGYVLVSRIVLPEEYVKELGSRQDVEFPLEVNLG